MLHKTRLIVKSHYGSNLADLERKSAVLRLLKNDDFCLEEDNPQVSLKSMPGCSLLLIMLAWRGEIFVSDHHQGSEKPFFFKFE